MSQSDDPTDAPDDFDEDLEAEEPAEPGDRARRRRRLERVLPEILRRAIERGIETGIGTISNANESIRGMVGNKTDVPREVATYVLSQIDDTKSAVVRGVAREVREFLDSADLSTEVQRALTALSFEIRTEIRFIPNDSGELRPDVRARVAPKRVNKTEPDESGD